MSRVPQASAALQSADLPNDLKREAIRNLASPTYPAKEELAALVLALKPSTLLQQALQGFLQQNAAGEGPPCRFHSLAERCMHITVHLKCNTGMYVYLPRLQQLQPLLKHRACQP